MLSPAPAFVDEPGRVAALPSEHPGALVRAVDFGVWDLPAAIATVRPALARAGWDVHQVGDAGYLAERIGRQR